MKKLFCRTLSLLLSGLLVASLLAPISHAEARLKIVCSFFPIYDLSKRVAGDLADVDLLMPVEADAHSFEPSVQDMAKIEDCDLFIYNGASMEVFLDRLLNSQEGAHFHPVCASDLVPLLPSHRTRKEKEAKTFVKRSYIDPAPNRKGHFDPHTWITPRNACLELEAIKNALVEADPEHAESFEENYQTALKDFQALASDYDRALQNLSQREIVVSHAAFAYLCNEYELEQIAIEGLEPHSEPSAKRLSEIIDEIRARKLKAVFFENAESSKVAETIAAETEAQVLVLYPMESLTRAQVEAGADLLSLMRENLDNLKKALK
ncbi:MAG: zinc ABC transporter substrate-binding protein [Eubacteriales bacterium]|nr:zinc ABC transporter substrate-binding protein [Eubacteriales bacterium]